MNIITMLYTRDNEYSCGCVCVRVEAQSLDGCPANVWDFRGLEGVRRSFRAHTHRSRMRCGYSSFSAGRNASSQWMACKCADIKCTQLKLATVRSPRNELNLLLFRRCGPIVFRRTCAYVRVRIVYLQYECVCVCEWLVGTEIDCLTFWF